MIAIILAAAALVIAAIALVFAVRNKKTVEVVKETKIVHAPVEHPFIYNDKEKQYFLDGSLKCSGTLSCLEKRA